MAYTVMSNMSESERNDSLLKTIDKADIDRLRILAERWMEIASSSGMKETKESWKKLHDLKPDKPMILFETFAVSGYVTEEELQCKNETLKEVERTMVYGIKQHEELKDDIVLESYYRLPWKVTKSDYGVKIVEHHAEDSLAYLSNFPIQTVDDVEKLKERTFSVDRQASLDLKEKLESIFGDILPVVIGNYDNFFPGVGFAPFTGNNFVGLTMDLFKLVGDTNMLMWLYDHPDVVHRLMRFLCDDRIRFYKWLKSEGILASNTDNQFGGPSSYGYVSELPAVGTKEEVDFKDCWVWPESQETITVSPQMFDEFFLKYIAEVSNMFGLAYYGCCEPLDDRIELIKKAIPSLRTVSISGWNDFQKIGEALGKDYVHCKKPNPAFISGEKADWANARKDLEDSFKVCPHGNMEIVVRDVYDIAGDMPRLTEWVKMAKQVVGR